MHEIAILQNEGGTRRARINGVECFRGCEMARRVLTVEDQELSSTLTGMFVKKYLDRCFKIGAGGKIPQGHWIDSALENLFGDHCYNSDVRVEATRLSIKWRSIAKAKGKLKAHDQAAAKLAAEPELPLVAPKKRAIRFKKAKVVGRKTFGTMASPHTITTMKMLAKAEGSSLADVLERCVDAYVLAKLSAQPASRSL